MVGNSAYSEAMTRPVRALAAVVVGLSTVLGMSSCADLDLISKDEQANRLQAAAAFGALHEDVRMMTASEYPGPDNLGDVQRWLTKSAEGLVVTDQRFGVWTTVTKELTFVPEDSPGPSEAMISDFDSAYVTWSATTSAFNRAVRKCLKNKKNKVAKRCLEEAQVASVASRAGADAELDATATTIRRSLENIKPVSSSPADPSASE